MRWMATNLIGGSSASKYPCDALTIVIFKLRQFSMLVGFNCLLERSP